MIQVLRSQAKRAFQATSQAAVKRKVAESTFHQEMWNATLKYFPSFRDHFSKPVDNPEIECRIRFLVAAECAFVASEIADVLKRRGRCSYADIGDSDGSVRKVLEERFSGQGLQTIGYNLQKSAVERMNAAGLKADCADAIEVGKKGTKYDVVSLFETLEHLPDPIGFLEAISNVVNDRLVISVPYIRESRVCLKYLSDAWPKGQEISIETVHIFELCPKDWEKIFLHSGWKVERSWIVKAFPKGGPLKWVMEWYWRRTSYEGFYFASLVRDESARKRYKIE